jgi:hypothetical protein
MKEIGVRVFLGLLQLVAVWLLILITAIVVATQMQGWLPRIAIVLAALISVPGYVLLQFKREEIANARRFEAGRAISLKESAAWAEIVAQPQELKIMASVPAGEPVDLRVRQPEGEAEPFNPHLPYMPKTVCWMDPPGTRCAHPNIATVQSEFIGRWYFPAAPKRSDEVSHLMWSFSIADQARTEVKELTARYILDVHKAERLSTLIARIRVTVVDGQTGITLAETAIYRKSWIGNAGRSPTGEMEARHHPERDTAIGKMLEQVFPGGGANGPPTVLVGDRL